MTEMAFTTWSELFQPRPSLVGSSKMKLHPSVFVLRKYLCVSSQSSTSLSDLARVLI